MILGVSSCRKGGEPIPKFDQQELFSTEETGDDVKTEEADGKGGDKGGDIVGGDDDEDDDGGIVVGGTGDSDRGGDVKGGEGDGFIGSSIIVPKGGN